jgi:hypothetical protein
MKQLTKIKDMAASHSYEIDYQESGKVIIFRNAGNSIAIDTDDKYYMRSPNSSLMRVITQVNGMRVLNYYYCIGNSFYKIDFDDYKKHLDKQLPAYNMMDTKQPGELYIPTIETLKDGWAHFEESIK